MVPLSPGRLRIFAKSMISAFMKSFGVVALSLLFHLSLTDDRVRLIGLG